MCIYLATTPTQQREGLLHAAGRRACAPTHATDAAPSSTVKGVQTCLGNHSLSHMFASPATLPHTFCRSIIGTDYAIAKRAASSPIANWVDARASNYPSGLKRQTPRGRKNIKNHRVNKVWCYFVWAANLMATSMLPPGSAGFRGYSRHTRDAGC